MQDNQITMTIRNGQADFKDIPTGISVLVKNYDTDVNPGAELSTEEMETNQVYKDEGGYYYSNYFQGPGSV